MKGKNNEKGQTALASSITEAELLAQSGKYPMGVYAETSTGYVRYNADGTHSYGKKGDIGFCDPVLG